MRKAIEAGSILIERDALHPKCFRLADDSWTNGWMSATHSLTPRELEKELSVTGWIFFFMAGAIRTTAFGFNRGTMVHAALKRVIAEVRQLKM